MNQPIQSTLPWSPEYKAHLAENLKMNYAAARSGQQSEGNWIENIIYNFEKCIIQHRPTNDVAALLRAERTLSQMLRGANENLVDELRRANDRIAELERQRKDGIALLRSTQATLNALLKPLNDRLTQESKR